MKSNSHSVRATFLGGLGDVGRNCLLLECQNDAILIDCGVLFPDERAPGVDLILPDLDLLDELSTNLRAAFFTHGHEDHIGAAPYLLRRHEMPLYGSPLTLALLNARLEEAGLAKDADMRRLRVHATVRQGCFEVTPFHVCHSIPDALGFAIRTPAGTLIHTGDYMLDNRPLDGNLTDLQLLGELGSEGVLALFADSTNADVPGHTPSQKSIYDGLAKVFAQAEYGRVIVASFASNLARVQQIADLAHQYGRRVCLLGRSLERNMPLAADLALLDIDPTDLLPTRLIDQVPHEELAIVCTGSQAEPGSALARLAEGRHPLLEIDEGDTVIISASTVPGNERPVQRMVGELFRRGANVIFGQLGDVHVSGHAAREDTRTLLSVVRPRFFVPVHGSHHHLALQGQVAIEAGLPEDAVMVVGDGAVLEIGPDRIAQIGQRQARYIHVDRGAPRAFISERILSQRRQLARAGMVVVSVRVDLRRERLVDLPQVRGVGLFDDADDVLADIAEGLGKRLASDPEPLADLEEAERKVKMLVGRQLKAETGLRPRIIAIVTAG